jgi:hypothetical protein
VCTPTAVAFWIQIVSAALQLLLMVYATLLEPLLYASSILHDFHESSYHSTSPVQQQFATQNTTHKWPQQQAPLHVNTTTDSSSTAAYFFSSAWLCSMLSPWSSPTPPPTGFAALAGSGCPG